MAIKTAAVSVISARIVSSRFVVLLDRTNETEKLAQVVDVQDRNDAVIQVFGSAEERNARVLGRGVAEASSVE